MPKPVLIAVIAVSGVVVLAAGWFLVLAPQSHKASSLRRQTADVRQQIADDLARTAITKNATSTPAIKTADVYKLATAMPSLTDMPDLLLELNQTARASGVKILTIQPSPPADSGSGYADVALTIEATGNFYTLTDLLYRLRNLVYVRNGTLQANGRLFSVTSVDVSPNGKLLDAKISANTYVYGLTGLVAPGLSTTTPAGTTTTATTTTATTTAPSGPAAAGTGGTS
jgi:Tfp pilus assembly protein PilO